MNCIECNKPLYEGVMQFRCCDAFVCGLICSKNRLKKIQEIDPNMDNPLNWNNKMAENKPIKNNKTIKNLQSIGMPYESIKLIKPIPLVKSHVIKIKNYKDNYDNSNINHNNRIGEMLVKGSILIVIALYLKKQYSILTLR